MKKQRFTEEQIIAVLKEQEAGAKAADLCRKHGVFRSAILQRRHGSVRGEASEGARRGKRQPNKSLNSLSSNYRRQRAIDLIAR